MEDSRIVAAVTSVLSTAVGTSTARAIARYRSRGSGLYTGGMMLPTMMPDIVLGFGLLAFFPTIGMQLSLLTIIISRCAFLTPCVVIVVQVRLTGPDPRLEETSANLGASPWTSFCKVTPPQPAPGIPGGGLLAFII